MTHVTEIEQKILTLRVAGKSYRQIAVELNTSLGTVARCSQKFALEISAAQHANLEEKLRQASGLKADRMERLAKILNRLESRLTEETLSELTAHQLIDRLIKIHQVLDQQTGALRLVATRKENQLKSFKIDERIEYLDFDI